MNLNNKPEPVKFTACQVLFLRPIVGICCFRTKYFTEIKIGFEILMWRYMIIYKTHEEVELMRQSALLVSKTLTEVARSESRVLQPYRLIK